MAWKVRNKVAKGTRRAGPEPRGRAAAATAADERVYAPLEDEIVVREEENSREEEFEARRRATRSEKSLEITQAPSMQEVFGPGGLLERGMTAGYEHRPAQLGMAERVQEAFQSHRHAIVEAGTGTGKTLAYLLPAICSGRRVVISTATKSLQEQLYQKDVPFLQKYFAPNLRVAVMKGRSNFL